MNTSKGLPLQTVRLVMNMHCTPWVLYTGWWSFCAAQLQGVCNDVGMKTDPPLEAHSEQHSGPDYYREEFRCGFNTKVFYTESSWAFNSAAKW